MAEVTYTLVDTLLAPVLKVQAWPWPPEVFSTRETLLPLSSCASLLPACCQFCHLVPTLLDGRERSCEVHCWRTCTPPACLRHQHAHCPHSKKLQTPGHRSHTCRGGALQSLTFLTQPTLAKFVAPINTLLRRMEAQLADNPELLTDRGRDRMFTAASGSLSRMNHLLSTAQNVQQADLEVSLQPVACPAISGSPGSCPYCATFWQSLRGACGAGGLPIVRAVAVSWLGNCALDCGTPDSRLL